MAWEDPIVAEVRKIREELSAKFNYDAAAIFADIRARQASAGERLVRTKPHPKSTPEKDLDATAAARSASF